MLILASACAPCEAAQAAQKQPLGPLEATGQVTINGNTVQGTQTVFPGDTVQTGANGAGSLNIAGVGRFTIAADTEILFPTSQYLATLKRGTVGMHENQATQSFELQFGNYFVFLPEYETVATATVTVAADGSARVECQLGSVGITAIEGAADVFLHPGQAVNISAAGELGAVEAIGGAANPETNAAPATPTSAPAPSKSNKKTLYILLGVGAGAAAAAGAAIAAHSSSTTSPSSPGGL